MIFNIHYNDDKRQLYSASDDRSVRIWQFSDCGLLPSSVVTADTIVTPLHVLYGHSARVWFVKQFGCNIVTASEVYFTVIAYTV